MKYDIRKAFPYPVLRPGSSDYQSGEFSMESELNREFGSTKIQLKAVFNLINPEQKKLIEEEKAKFALLVSCSSTFYRNVIESKENMVNYCFTKGQLYEKVELCPFVVTTKNLNGFKLDVWHEDYSQMSFDLKVGSVLAVGESRIFHIDLAEESPPESIFLLQKDNSLEVGQWNCSFGSDHDKVTISLSEDDYDHINSIRVDNKGDANIFLLNSVYFPALVWLLSEMDRFSENGDYEDYAECAWFRSIESKLDELNCSKIGSGCDRIIDAQKIFESPLKELLYDIDERH